MFPRETGQSQRNGKEEFERTEINENASTARRRSIYLF
jgi:hypothetical protein